MDKAKIEQEEQIANFIEENSDWIADVLRHSEDSYARACALTLLAYGGTQREIELVKRDLEAIET